MDPYNCILIPISNFDKKNKPKDRLRFFSRIKAYNFFLQNEIAVYNILKTNSNNKLYFYIFETVEQITYNEINDKHLSLEYSTTIKDTDTYVVRYIDKKFFSLEEIFTDCSSSNKTQIVRFLMNSYKKLLKSIDLLLQNNIVHNNISSFSIGIDETKEPFLFKFELSMVLTKSNVNIEYLRKYFFTYKPDYYYWSLELHALSYLISNNLSTFTLIHIDNLLEDIIKNNKIISKFGMNIKNLYESEGKKYLSKFINKPLDHIVPEILKYSTTWDNFRLSIVYLEIIINHFHLSNKFIQNFIKLLLINTHFNPALRHSISKTIDTFEEICYNTDIADFKNIKL